MIARPEWIQESKLRQEKLQLAKRWICPHLQEKICDALKDFFKASVVPLLVATFERDSEHKLVLKFQRSEENALSISIFFANREIAKVSTFLPSVPDDAFVQKLTGHIYVGFVDELMAIHCRHVQKQARKEDYPFLKFLGGKKAIIDAVEEAAGAYIFHTIDELAHSFTERIVREKKELDTHRFLVEKQVRAMVIDVLFGMDSFTFARPVEKAPAQVTAGCETDGRTWTFNRSEACTLLDLTEKFYAYVRDLCGNLFEVHALGTDWEEVLSCYPVVSHVLSREIQRSLYSALEHAFLRLRKGEAVDRISWEKELLTLEQVKSQPPTFVIGAGGENSWDAVAQQSFVNPTREAWFVFFFQALDDVLASIHDEIINGRSTSDDFQFLKYVSSPDSAFSLLFAWCKEKNGKDPDSIAEFMVSLFEHVEAALKPRVITPVQKTQMMNMLEDALAGILISFAPTSLSAGDRSGKYLEATFDMSRLQYDISVIQKSEEEDGTKRILKTRTKDIHDHDQRIDLFIDFLSAVAEEYVEHS